MSAPTLRDALNALAQAAAKAGFDASAAAAEGRLLSAAVAEANPGAYLEWCAQLEVPVSAQEFMDAAVRGRRYRASATPLASQAAASPSAVTTAYLDALEQVCLAAATLGQPGPDALGAASLAAAAQRPRPVVTPTPTAVGSQPSEEEFLAQAPGILADVLGRLAESQQRIQQASRSGLLDLSGLNPHVGGAFPGLSQPGSAPTPAAPAMPATPAAPAVPEAQPVPVPEAAAEPAEPQKSVEEWLAELDELTGLAGVKAEIHRQTAILRVDALRTKAGLKSPTITRHLVFTGNPGTGKTTVARLVGGIYKAIGLLSKGQLVEVDRSELVAGYLGQTAIKTSEVAAKAYGGVLFIDEAYSLNGDQYGEEAVNTLVKEMEDHRDDLVVIVAGYPEPMSEFIDNNPGLASRFRTTIDFEDYTDDELRSIFTSMAAKSDYDLGEGCLDEFNRQLALQVRDQTFGNGRYVRNILEAAVGRHAWRLRDITEPTLEQLRSLLPGDLSEPEPEPGQPLKAPAGAKPSSPVEFPAPAEEQSP